VAGQQFNDLPCSLSDSEQIFFHCPGLALPASMSRGFDGRLPSMKVGVWSTTVSLFEAEAIEVTVLLLKEKDEMQERRNAPEQESYSIVSLSHAE